MIYNQNIGYKKTKFRNGSERIGTDRNGSESESDADRTRHGRGADADFLL